MRIRIWYVPYAYGINMRMVQNIDTSIAMLSARNTSLYTYGTYHMRMVYKIVPYAYGTYHTHNTLWYVPYAYGTEHQHKQ